MGQYIRWQAIIAFLGIALLALYLNSINLVRTTVIVPAEGGRFREGVVGRPEYLNPLLSVYNPIDQDITALIFEGLTRDDGLGNLEPILASNWSVSDDGRVYVFTLRENVRWSDGVAFTSNDVVHTIRLIQDDQYPGDAAWQRVWQSVDVEQVDDYTVRFVLAEPFPSFIYHTTVGILPYHLWQNVQAADLLRHPLNLTPIGTGPFRLTEATDQHVLLDSNPRYYGRPARIKQVEFKFYTNTNQLVTAFQAEEIDGIGRVGLQDMVRLQADASLHLHSASIPRYEIVYLNQQQPETLPFLQDSAVRQSLSKLIDRQDLIDQVLFGQAIEAKGPFLPWAWAYNPDQSGFDYDPVAALQLFEETAWLLNEDGVREKEGVRLSFSLLAGDEPIQRAVANYLIEQWHAAGVEVNLEVTDNLPERLAGRQFEVALAEVQLFGDPDPYAYWHQTQVTSGQNFAGWDNTEASLVLEAGRISTDHNERIQQYYQFQRIFAEEMPALTLYHPVYTYAVRDTVREVQLSSMATASDRFKNIPDWYLLTRRVLETNSNTLLNQLNSNN